MQGAKLPVDRRPSSPAPPVYQEEFESFFNCEGTEPSEASSVTATCFFMTMLCHFLDHWHGRAASAFTVLHCVTSLTHLLTPSMIPATFTLFLLAPTPVLSSQDV